MVAGAIEYLGIVFGFFRDNLVSGEERFVTLVTPNPLTVLVKLKDAVFVNEPTKSSMSISVRTADTRSELLVAKWAKTFNAQEFEGRRHHEP